MFSGPSIIKVTVSFAFRPKFSYKVSSLPLESIAFWTKEEGIEDETHLIIESENEILQSELQEDENSKLFQLGLTVEEAEEIIENPGLALAKYKGEVE